MRVYVVRKWPLRGRSRFVCWNITRVSLWFCATCISCKVRKVTLPRDLADLKARIIATVKHIDAPMLTRVKRTWISYRWVPCHPWCTHRTYLVVKKKLFFRFPVAVSNSIKAFGFLVINVCNHGEHYETPCIVYSCMQLNKNTKKHCCVSVATMVMRTRLNVMALEHSLSTWCVVDRAS